MWLLLGEVMRTLSADDSLRCNIPLNYVNDVDLNLMLIEWENFYNFSRPHGAYEGRTPYEILRDDYNEIWMEFPAGM